jgi:hypothetical protein
MLVPANQRYLPEIDDLDLRRRLTALIMNEVLPKICGSLAGTTYGFALHWTFGRHRLKRSADSAKQG